jgi:hypothetical protein
MEKRIGSNGQRGAEGVIWSMIMGRWFAHALHAAAELDLATLIGDERKSSVELAASTGAHAPSLYRLLRALAGSGVFAQVGEADLWEQSPASRALARGPGSLRAQVLLDGEPAFSRAWSQLLSSVSNGETAFSKINGVTAFEYLTRHGAVGALFDETMVNNSAVDDLAILNAYDFSWTSSLADVGGGYGALLVAVLNRYPAIRGTLCDLPRTVEGARQHLARELPPERWEVVGLDATQSPPPPSSCYVLKYLVHAMDDATALAVLRNVRRAIRRSGRLLVVEQLIAHGNEWSPAKWMDLHMLAITGGGARTEREHRTLLEAAGFRLERVVPTSRPVAVVEAFPV